jgi:hypothetical protein
VIEPPKVRIVTMSKSLGGTPFRRINAGRLHTVLVRRVKKSA